MTFTEIDPVFRLPDEVWERLKEGLSRYKGKKVQDELKSHIWVEF